MAFQLRQFDKAQWTCAAVAFGWQRGQAQQAETVRLELRPRMLGRCRLFFVGALGGLGVGHLRVPGLRGGSFRSDIGPSSRGYRLRGA